MENGEPDIALDILRDIFVMNTKKNPSEYPVRIYYSLTYL